MQVFVARQPIFDRQQKVHAYELLFRSGIDNYFDHFDEDQASSKVMIDGFLSIGIEKLTGGKKAFINFTRDLLINEYATLFPKQFTVIELLENMEPDEKVIAACRKLKKLGYLLALDDFIHEEKLDPLVALADIIKIDFLQIKGDQRRACAQKFGSQGTRILAKKVETAEEFNQAMEMGYTDFQGYFFSKPVIISGKAIPGFKLNYLRILQEISHLELDMRRIEAIIKQEVSISYKLLKYINSALFGFRRRIESIGQVLALLGETNVRKWVSLIALSGMGEDKPMELVINSLVRARFCELAAPKIGLRDRSQDLFLLGMFSMIDAIIDRPMPEILAELPISADIKGALLGGSSRFRDVHEAMFAYERGNWETFSESASKLRLDETAVPDLYQESVEWANQIFELA